MGHAFHNFERNHLPYYQQRRVTSEFAEVASMAMELLASPYLSLEGDGFYSKRDAARARVERHFSMETMAQQTLALYQSSLAGC